MKRFPFFTCLLLSVCASAQIETVIPAKPDPPKLVNDFAALLTPEQATALERKLVAYGQRTTNQMAVVTLPTITDAGGIEYPVEKVASGILNNWGVGTKEKNNGIVILIAKKERKVRIETGYGLEGPLPDDKLKHIIDDYMVKAFGESDYYRGLDSATNAIIGAAGQPLLSESFHDSHEEDSPRLFGTVFLFLTFLFALI